MQFETILRVRVPRAKCKACGNVKSAAGLLRLDWDSVHRIMQRAVERGLARRELDSLPYVGIDEKSFRRGQSYISILTDLTGARVLEVTEGRDEKARFQSCFLHFILLSQASLGTIRANVPCEQIETGGTWPPPGREAGASEIANRLRTASRARMPVSFPLRYAECESPSRLRRDSPGPIIKSESRGLELADGLPLTKSLGSKDVLACRIAALGMSGAGLAAVDGLAGALNDESPFTRQAARTRHGPGVCAVTERQTLPAFLEGDLPCEEH